jgi:hypothetical protein
MKRDYIWTAWDARQEKQKQEARRAAAIAKITRWNGSKWHTPRTAERKAEQLVAALTRLYGPGAWVYRGGSHLAVIKSGCTYAQLLIVTR